MAENTVKSSSAFLHIEVDSFPNWMRTVSDLQKQAADTLVVNGEVFGDKKWLFRGQSDSRWPITSSLERMNKVVCCHLREPERYFRAIERIAIEEFKRRAHTLIENDNLSNLEWTMLMRHHGVPTRLVDFTEVPLFALFFALEDDASEDFAIWAVARDAMRDWYTQSKMGSRVPGFSELSKSLAPNQITELINRNESDLPAARPLLDFMRIFKKTKDNAYKRIVENRRFAERIFTADLDDFLLEAKKLPALYLYADKPNVRQCAQRGLFLMSSCVSTPFMSALKDSLELPADVQPKSMGLEECMADRGGRKVNIQDAKMIQFVFKSSLRQECRDFLQSAGISPSSVYPDLFGISIETKQLIFQSLTPSHDFTEFVRNHFSEILANGSMVVPDCESSNFSEAGKESRTAREGSLSQ